MFDHLPGMGKVEEDSISDILQLEAICTDIPVPDCHVLIQAMLFEFLSRLVGSLLMEVERMQVSSRCNSASKGVRERS